MLSQVRKRNYLVLIAVTICISLFAGKSNAIDNTSLVRLKNTVNTLRQIEVEPGDTNIPKVALPLLTDLRRQIQHLVKSSLARTDEPRIVRQLVVDALNGIGASIGPPDDSGESSWRPYGALTFLSIEKPNNAINTIFVVASISLNCGTDSALWIMKKKASGWQCIFADELNQYDSLDSAHSHFSYRLLPDGADDFYLAVADVSPWCSSWWRTIRYRLYQLNVKKEESKPLLTKHDDIWIGGFRDPFYVLSTADNQFILEYYGGKTEEPLVSEPPMVTRTFSIQKGKVIEKAR
jgi:hypothetical protein